VKLQNKRFQVFGLRRTAGLKSGQFDQKKKLKAFTAEFAENAENAEKAHFK